MKTNVAATHWETVTNEPVQVGGEWQETVTPIEGTLDEAYGQYYRLKKPVP